MYSKHIETVCLNGKYGFYWSCNKNKTHGDKSGSFIVQDTLVHFSWLHKNWQLFRLLSALKSRRKFYRPFSAYGYVHRNMVTSKRNQSLMISDTPCLIKVHTRFPNDIYHLLIALSQLSHFASISQTLCGRKTYLMTLELSQKRFSLNCH